MSEIYCKISLKKLSGKPNKPGYHNGEFKKFFGSTKTNPRLSFSRAEFFKNSPKHIRGLSISGVQQKLSLRKNEKHELEITQQNGEYILKPSPEAYPGAAENEHAAMAISRLLGIDTAACALVAFADGELAYITRRFDRLGEGQKLHQEDLMQCFDLASDHKYSKTYEEAGKLIFAVTNGKQAAVLDFVKRVMLAYITGNDDLHLKNISVQRLADSNINNSHFYDRLTPNYDCLFCEALKDNVSGMGLLALGLLHDQEDGDEYFSDSYNHYGYYTGSDFLELGRRLGLLEKPIKSFIHKLNTNRENITDLIRHSYMPDTMKERAIELVESRIKALSITDID